MWLFELLVSQLNLVAVEFHHILVRLRLSFIFVACGDPVRILKLPVSYYLKWRVNTGKLNMNNV